MAPRAADERPHLSHSRLQRYLTCPEQYRLYYVEKLRARRESASLVFGAIVHQALAALLRDGADPVELFQREWQTVQSFELRYSKRETWEMLGQIGQRLLEKFCREEARKIDAVLAVEAPFRFGISTLEQPFVGILDLVAQMNGKRTLVEFKTAAADYEPYEVELSDQLTAYRLAKAEVEQFAICVLVKARQPRIVWHRTQRHPGQVAEYLEKLESISLQLSQQIFYKRPGRWCRQCEFLPVCTGDQKKAAEALVKLV